MTTEDILKSWVIEEIINRDATYINSLPPSLLSLAVSYFNQDTASSFVNNIGFQSIVGEKGTSSQKTVLVKILMENINKNNLIDETFIILENIELSLSYNKSMIYGALQSYKATNNIDDSRVDDLIEKFKA